MYKTLDVLGITVFAIMALCGVLVTALAPIREENWWLWPGLRAALQVGGGLWGGLAMAGLAETGLRGRLSLGAGGLLLGALLAINPLRDLGRGPLELSAVRIVSAGTWSLENWDVHHAGATRRGDGIEGELIVIDPDGVRYRFTPIGLHANRLAAMLDDCATTNDVRVFVLPHLDIVVSMRCPERPELTVP